jgi:hypothetical protein
LYPHGIKVGRAISAALLGATLIGLGAGLGGCSDIYFDHRDTVSLSAGDAVAANKVAQMVDPWPPESRDRNLQGNGQRARAAVERYRENRVTAPASSTTSSASYQAVAPSVAAPTKP